MKYNKATKSLASRIGLLAGKGELNQLKMAIIYWSRIQKFTYLTTFEKAEAIHATPQDLSTLLRWA